jgi:molybdenum cofactor biosynthesis enzyme MoaA
LRDPGVPPIAATSCKPHVRKRLPATTHALAKASEPDRIHQQGNSMLLHDSIKAFFSHHYATVNVSTHTKNEVMTS